MTICQKNQISNKKTTINGLYFIRRRRSPIIDAVRLKGNDCEVILNIFYSYWAKAKKRENKEPDTVDIIDVENAKHEILSAN
jgi:hypothetical protein